MILWDYLARRSAHRGRRSPLSGTMERVEDLVELVGAGDVLVLSGAGLSTDSPTGSWTTHTARSQQVQRLR